MLFTDVVFTDKVTAPGRGVIYSCPNPRTLALTIASVALNAAIMAIYIFIRINLLINYNFLKKDSI